MITAAEAAAELLRRQEAADSLLSFTEYTLPRYKAAPHHKTICDALEAVERGDIRRLIISVAPRFGKSELASRRFPAWFIGRNPEKEIIAASYNSELAGDFGKEVRNIVASEGYSNVFPSTRLAGDSRAANRWHTEQGGGYAAAGVGTAMTGRGAHVLLIDDPVKDRSEADSDTVRESIWQWYASTAYTRLTADGCVIVIQTRWHEDDLTGRLLEAEKLGGDTWHKIVLPALDEDGVSLWPERFNKARLEKIRDVVGMREWNALYMQDPVPDEGDYFKREWFAEYDKAPEGLSIYGGSDYAVTEDGGDFTEHGIIGVDFNDNIYLLDWWRGQTKPDAWIEQQCNLIIKHQPLCWFGEVGPIRRSVEPFLVRRMAERQAYARLEWLPSINEKTARARPIQARASMGKVFVPKSAPWKDALMTQVLKFPNTKFDDGVDVLSLFGRGLEHIIAPSKKRKQQAERAINWMS